MALLSNSFKLKSILWKCITIIVFGYTAIINILLINMFQVNITTEMRILTKVVWAVFIIGLILRLIKPKNIMLPFVIIADVVLLLIMFTQDGLSADTFEEALVNPMLFLNIFVIIIFALDWKFRYQKFRQYSL